MAESFSDVLQLWPTRYQASDVEPSTANASAVEWPTLHEAINMSKRRASMRYEAEDDGW